jgi:putative NADH-flavin reductase
MVGQHAAPAPHRRERTGRYRVRAGDLPITDEHGESRITVPDYAAAIVDTVESGRFVGARFTAAY